MLRRLRDAAAGVGAALASLPAQRASALERYVAETPPRPRRLADDRLERRLAAADLTLRVLSRLPGLPYRNTCLFRSLARVRLLRGSGRAVRMRIGVLAGTAGDGAGEIRAHAWLEGETPPHRDDEMGRSGGFLPLSAGDARGDGVSFP